MKASTLILAVSLIVAFSIGRASSDEADDSALDELRQEVKQLQSQVALLMADHRVDQNDIDVLLQRVEAADLVRKQTEALFQAGGARGSAEQLHHSNAAFRLAQARLNLARGEYDASMDNFEAALAASKQARVTLENKLDAGTVRLSELIGAQQFAADIQLERNRMRRRIEVLNN